MDRSNLCGCKGYRTCLICEEKYGLNYGMKSGNLTGTTYVYCPHCNLSWPGIKGNEYNLHPNHGGSHIDFPGVYIDLNFLNDEEEKELMKGIDGIPWSLSQSGRRKQNFGPKCNFKKRKLRVGDFCGFPKFSEFVQEKFKTVPILKNFNTIEQCSLEYDPTRGASIDPHIDDCWIWGERIVTVNLLSDSVLTMTYNQKSESYNLGCVETYPSVVREDSEPFKVKKYDKDIEYPIVRIPMPRRSLLVLYGAARYDWEHRVLREDINERRVCLAYREFTPLYLPGGEKHDEASETMLKAKLFW